MALWIIVGLLVVVLIVQAITWLTVLRFMVIMIEDHEKQSKIVDWISDRIQEHDEALDSIERRR